MNNNDKDEQTTSRHSATDPQKCREMERKYGWKLLRIEQTKDRTLKFDCVFKGETEFPNYIED
ncbi:MAG: hypothetical protein Fur006_25110 [Coleofasciculaceae cyanobacterium]